MHDTYRRFPLIIRIVSAILIITFISQDILWAHPDQFTHLASQRSDKLSTESFIRSKDAEARALEAYIIRRILELAGKNKEAVTLTDINDAVRTMMDHDGKRLEGVDITRSTFLDEVLIIYFPGYMLRFFIYDADSPNIDRYGRDRTVSTKRVRAGQNLFVQVIKVGNGLAVPKPEAPSLGELGTGPELVEGPSMALPSGGKGETENEEKYLRMNDDEFAAILREEFRKAGLGEVEITSKIVRLFRTILEKHGGTIAKIISHFDHALRRRARPKVALEDAARRQATAIKIEEFLETMIVELERRHLPETAAQVSATQDTDESQSSGIFLRRWLKVALFTAAGILSIAALTATGCLDWYIAVKSTGPTGGLIVWKSAILDILTGIAIWGANDITGQYLNQRKGLRFKQSLVVAAGGAVQGLATHMLYNAVELLPIFYGYISQMVARAVFIGCGGLVINIFFTALVAACRKMTGAEEYSGRRELRKARDVVGLKFVTAPIKTFIIVNLFPYPIRVISEQVWEYLMKLIDSFLMNRRDSFLSRSKPEAPSMAALKLDASDFEVLKKAGRMAQIRQGNEWSIYENPAGSFYDPSDGEDWLNPIIRRHIWEGNAVELEGDEVKRISRESIYGRAGIYIPDAELKAKYIENGLFGKIRRARDTGLLNRILGENENFRNLRSQQRDQIVETASRISLSVILGHAIIGEVKEADGKTYDHFVHARTGLSRLTPTVWIGELLLNKITAEELAQLILEECQHIIKPPKRINNGRWINMHGRIANNPENPQDVIEHNESFMRCIHGYAATLEPVGESGVPQTEKKLGKNEQRQMPFMDSGHISGRPSITDGYLKPQTPSMATVSGEGRTGLWDDDGINFSPLYVGKKIENPRLVIKNKDNDCRDDGDFYNRAIAGIKLVFKGIANIEAEVITQDISPSPTTTARIIDDGERKPHIIVNKAFVMFIAFLIKYGYDNITLVKHEQGQAISVSASSGVEMPLIRSILYSIASLEACRYHSIATQADKDYGASYINIVSMLYFWSLASNKRDTRLKSAVTEFIGENSHIFGVESMPAQKMTAYLEAWQIIERARIDRKLPRPKMTVTPAKETVAPKIVAEWREYGNMVLHHAKDEAVERYLRDGWNPRWVLFRYLISRIDSGQLNIESDINGIAAKLAKDIGVRKKTAAAYLKMTSELDRKTMEAFANRFYGGDLCFVMSGIDRDDLMTTITLDPTDPNQVRLTNLKLIVVLAERKQAEEDAAIEQKVRRLCESVKDILPKLEKAVGDLNPESPKTEKLEIITPIINSMDRCVLPVLKLRNQYNGIGHMISNRAGSVVTILQLSQASTWSHDLEQIMDNIATMREAIRKLELIVER